MENPVEWVFSVIVAGIAVNLLSAYMKPYIDKLWGWYSESQRYKNERQKRTFEQRVQTLLKDDLGVLDLKLDLIYRSIQSAVLSIVYILACYVSYLTYPALMGFIPNNFSFSDGNLALILLSLFLVIVVSMVGATREQRTLLLSVYERRRQQADELLEEITTWSWGSEVYEYESTSKQLKASDLQRLEQRVQELKPEEYRIRVPPPPRRPPPPSTKI